MKKLLTNSRIGEVDDASDRLLVHYDSDKSLHDDPFLKTTFDEIRPLSDQMTEAIKRGKVYSEMDEADIEVEEAFHNVKDVVRGYFAMSLPQFKTAADEVDKVTQKYKAEILRLNYSLQSSNIEAMLMDLSAPALQPHITALIGLPEVIEKLREKQGNFKTKRVVYDKAVADNLVLANAQSLKKPLLQLINGRLLPYLDVMMMTNPDKYSKFVGYVAQTIETINQVVRRRKDKDETNESK